MERQLLKQWLEAVAAGGLTPDQALEKLAGFPYQELPFAKIDTHRALRSGQAEVVYCPQKTPQQVLQIFRVLAEQSRNVLATRASRAVFRALQAEIPEVEYFAAPRLAALWRDRRQSEGTIGVIAAGTADLSVAEEAAVTAEILGSRVCRIYDVGVAGLHRLFDQKSLLDQCRVLVVVAGMEGALASVVGGLASQPIVAVPTSVGYGANFQGLAPLLAMLNSCASGVGVVNIDNGFGAGVLAHRINLLGEEPDAPRLP